MGRYEEELARGAGIERALEASVGHTGAAVVTGGTTTAVAFFTMCFNEFVGLREFGIVAGSGVLLCLAANLLLLPAFYVVMDRRKSPAVLRQKAEASSFPAEKINAALFRSPRAVLVGAALLTLAAAFFIPRIGFDYNLLNLQDRRSTRSARRRRSTPRATRSSRAYSVADNVEQARERIARFKALPTVADVRAPIVDLTPRRRRREAGRHPADRRLPPGRPARRRLAAGGRGERQAQDRHPPQRLPARRHRGQEVHR